MARRILMPALGAAVVGWTASACGPVAVGALWVSTSGSDGPNGPSSTPLNVSVAQAATSPDRYFKLVVTWEYPENNDDFVVERELVDGDWEQITDPPILAEEVSRLPDGRLAFEDSELQPDTRYFYRVASTNRSQQRKFSSSVSQTTAATPAIVEWGEGIWGYSKWGPPTPGPN